MSASVKMILHNKKYSDGTQAVMLQCNSGHSYAVVVTSACNNITSPPFSLIVNSFTATAGTSSSSALVGSTVSLSAAGGTNYYLNALRPEPA
ncbi:hypothetical protein BH09BAC4_BH09BAC4_32740 [soil metagenome]